MPWLNIDRQLEYDYDPLLLDMYEIEAEDAWVDFPLVVVDCDMPFRAGKKELNDYWGYGQWETTSHGIRIYSFIRYVIENNIGKSFSNAFRYFCKFVKPYLQYYFLDHFANYNSRVGRHYERYYIDDDDIIRADKDRFKNWNHKDDKYFRTFDFEETWTVETTRMVTERNWKKQILQTKQVVSRNTETFRRGIADRYLKGFENYHPKGFVKAIELKSQVGFKEKVDSKKSARYQKLKQEDDRRKRKQEREIARQKKKTVYSFMTKQEVELKRLKALDQYNLERHGFNNESFKGNPYHGRKNKKNGRAKNIVRNGNISQR